MHFNTGAEYLCAGDNFCLTLIGGGLSRLRTGVGTMHLAEILASTEGDAARAAPTTSYGWARRPFPRRRAPRSPTPG